MGRKWIRIIMLCCVLAALLSVTVLAEESGTCGTELIWTLNDAGILTISGTGPMTSYEEGKAPWYASRRSIQEIKIESGVTTIGNYAFQGCISVENVILPNSVTSMGNYSFLGCSSLQAVTLSANLDAIPWCAFYKCFNLVHIPIPNGVTSIGPYAFNSCSSLRNITIPGTVPDIGNGAYGECTRLTTVTLQNGVQGIDMDAFKSCVGLQEIVIPASVTAIGGYAFQYCSSLHNVYYTGTEAQWQGIHGHEGVPYDATIHYSYASASIALRQTSLSLTVGASANLTANVSPVGTAVHWSSTHPDIATVSDSGVVTAVWPGTATILATATPTGGSTISASCVVTVIDTESSVSPYYINSLTVRNSSGNVLSTIPDGPFLVTVSVTNTASSATPIVFLAAYDSDGKYQGLMYVSVEESTGTTVKITLPVENSGGAIQQLKAFVVASFADMTPLGTAVSFPAA